MDNTATQIMMDIVQRLTSIEHRLGAIEKGGRRASESASLPLTKLWSFSKLIANSAGGQWSIAMLTAAYILRGGDLLTLVSSLRKLFG